MALQLTKRGELRPWRVVFIPLKELKEHEHVNEAHLLNLMKEIINDRILKKPIIVDVNTLIILDGHHRYAVLQLLGAEVIPAYLVDYNSEKVRVDSWRKGWKVTKELVLKAGLTGKKLPFKTSRHTLDGIKVPDVNVPLEKLGVKLELGGDRR